MLEQSQMEDMVSENGVAIIVQELQVPNTEMYRPLIRIFNTKVSGC